MPQLPAPPHMTPVHFRVVGTRMVAWIADYMERVEQLPVGSRDAPGDGLARVPMHPPETGLAGEAQAASGDPASAWEQVFADLARVVEPGLTHWQHPSFFGYFPCNASGPAILGELLSAGLGVQGMLWATSPIATELETRMLDWCAELFGLPECFRSTGPGGGVIQGTASDATLVALLAARGRAAESRATVYASEQAHSSVLKAAMIAGVARDASDRRRVRLIESDAAGRMDAGALRDALDADLGAGLEPAFVCATLGTTGLGAMDPLGEIADVLRDRAARAWLHVDAAWAGAALVCPEHRAWATGLEHADSLCINPHKWLLTNFDCDLFWVRDRRLLLDSLSITPEYLRTAASDAGAVIDYRDWQVPLGRRFRALKLWFVIRHYGAEGLRTHIRRHVAWADELGRRLAADPRFELVVQPSLGLVCARLRAGDAPTRALIAAVNQSGLAYVSHATTPAQHAAPGSVFMRVAIGSTAAEHRHVRALGDLLDRLATEVLH